MGTRNAVLTAWLYVGTTAAVGTELLSAVGQLHMPGVLALWMVAAIVFAFTRRRRHSSPLNPSTRVALSNCTAAERAVFAGCVALSVGELIVALIAPPNTVDSVVYHMPRVEHWIAHASTAFFPTSDLRELAFPPLAEYLALQLRLLSGGDHLANLVQWSASVVSAIGITLISANLGGSRRAQLFALMFCCTLPIGLLEATSTQTDWVVCSFLVCFVVQITSAAQKNARFAGAAAGFALALAALTKPTTYVFAAPYAAWYLVRRKSARLILLWLAIALAVDGACWMRNYALFGSPLAAHIDDCPLVNNPMSAHATLSNAVRYAAINVAAPVGRVNNALTHAVLGLHRAAGWDASDPRYTVCGQTFSVTGNIFNEDFAPSPLHALLLLAAVAALAIGGRARFRGHPQLAAYAACWLVGIGFFLLTLQWSPWGNRYLVATFALGAPLFGLALSASTARVMGACSAAIFSYGLAVLLFCDQRPVFGTSRYGSRSIFTASREKQYLPLGQSNKYQSFTQVADRLAASSCRRIAIRAGEDMPEYVLWAFLRDRGVRNAVIEHIGVNNVSSELRDTSARYCAAVSDVPGEHDSDVLRGSVGSVVLEQNTGALKLYFTSP